MVRRIETIDEDKVMELGIMILNKRVPLEEWDIIERYAVIEVIKKVEVEVVRRRYGLTPDCSIIDKLEAYKDGEFDRICNEVHESEKQIEWCEVSIDESCVVGRDYVG